jgi:hypothetical protein
MIERAGVLEAVTVGSPSQSTTATQRRRSRRVWATPRVSLGFIDAYDHVGA